MGRDMTPDRNEARLTWAVRVLALPSLGAQNAAVFVRGRITSMERSVPI
jgi:hypothetical protein